MLKLYRVILFGITLSVVCTISPCIADDYEILEKALKDASVEVNKLNMPGLIYQLDEKSAEKYFEKYFSRNYLNNALRVNIGYPVFHWGNNHKNLQMALSNVLMRHLEEFFAGHSSPSSISTAFKADNHRHNHIFCTLVFFVDIANSKKLSSEYKLDVLKKLASLLKVSRLSEIRNARIDESGGLRVVAVPVEKKNGLVSAILLYGKRYTFDYKDGIIAKINSLQRPQLQ